MNTYRKRDHKGEQIVHAFLNKYFYPHLFQKTMEVKNKKEQLSGTDEKIYLHGDWKTIDEKVQLTRLNQSISEKTTQCLEILSLGTDGDYKEGWFIKNNTNLYLFTYITKCSVNFPEDLNNIEQIECIRAILISKKNLQNMLKDNSCDITTLKKEAHLLLNGQSDKETRTHCYKYLPSKNIWLCKTKKNFLKECPINAVIRWNLYEKYAWHVYNITKDNLILIK